MGCISLTMDEDEGKDDGEEGEDKDEEEEGEDGNDGLEGCPTADTKIVNPFGQNIEVAITQTEMVNN